MLVEKQQATNGGNEVEEELSVATSSDRQAVVDMCGDVYNGIDYLQDTFDDLVQGPWVKAFVYKVNGEMAAFASTSVMDSGRSLLIKAARVRPTLQGGGVYGRFRRSLFQQFADKHHYPTLEREAANLSTKNTKERTDAMTKSGWRLVETKHNPVSVFETANLSRLPDMHLQNDIVPVSKDQLHHLLTSDPSHWRHLFPNNRIIIAWTPYTADPEDVDHMFQHYDLELYGTLEDESSTENNSNEGGDVTLNSMEEQVEQHHKEKGKISSGKFSVLTAGTYYKCKLGISYHVDVFGRVSDGDDVILDHVRLHLQRIKNMPGLKARVVFNVFALEKLEKTVAKATKDLDTFTVGHHETHGSTNLWERDLNL